MKPEKINIFNVKTIIGALIILAGLIALLNNLGFYMGIDLWDFWPVILIVVGIDKLLQPKEYRNTFGGFIILAVGILFQLCMLDIINFGWDQIWPFILILVGLGIIRQAFWSGGKPEAIENNVINFTILMGGAEYSYVSKNLVGGSTTTIMGGGTIDLSNAEMDGDSMVIDIFALMGGVDIVIPKHWRVVIKGLPIMGGMSDKTLSSVKTPGVDDTPPEHTKQLIIKGIAIMGGVEIKN